MQLTLECKKRPEGSKPNALRRQGLIPAALYGHKGTESVSLTLDEKDAYFLLRQASVNNTLVDLKVPDISWNGKVLIKEVQAHPWKKTLYHLSFFSVASHASVEVSVPLNLIGQAPGVKLGGVLEQMLTELTVQCAPDRIPESIDINVSDMDIGTSLQVKDLVVPEGVTIVDAAETSVLSIVAPTVATEDKTETEEA
ncbi:50S ribosomal protein L25/general stress protein Ctc [Candidatus Gracilibacteria bacterium]|nr:50S ribosomal protein L25/general stress protein Ctc [Candidatus Gracilibacteria bacterium]